MPFRIINIAPEPVKIGEGLYQEIEYEDSNFKKRNPNFETIGYYPFSTSLQEMLVTPPLFTKVFNRNQPKAIKLFFSQYNNLLVSCNTENRSELSFSFTKPIKQDEINRFCDYFFKTLEILSASKIYYSILDFVRNKISKNADELQEMVIAQFQANAYYVELHYATYTLGYSLIDNGNDILANDESYYSKIKNEFKYSFANDNYTRKFSSFYNRKKSCYEAILTVASKDNKLNITRKFYNSTDLQNPDADFKEERTIVDADNNLITEKVFGTIKSLEGTKILTSHFGSLIDLALKNDKEQNLYSLLSAITQDPEKTLTYKFADEKNVMVSLIESELKADFNPIYKSELRCDKEYTYSPSDFDEQWVQQINEKYYNLKNELCIVRDVYFYEKSTNVSRLVQVDYKNVPDNVERIEFEKIAVSNGRSDQKETYFFKNGCYEIVTLSEGNFMLNHTIYDADGFELKKFQTPVPGDLYQEEPSADFVS